VNACAVIPVYNHAATVGTVVAGLCASGLPCLLVDDGCDADCAHLLGELQAADPQSVRLVRLATNSGKGAAVMAGMRAAHAAGFSHVLQIDADAQHDIRDVPRFLALARAAPERIICGCPIFDATVPKARKYGRWLTTFWVHINTLSPDIRDAMCGFRVYPLIPCIELFERVQVGQRMDFDIEVLVRLHWLGLRVVNQPTRVLYPPAGISHFDMLHDNLRIAAMHTRLFFGMLLRLPILLARRVARPA
jgi:glycosyltransferase involved in cell wall biosynthesis